VKVLRFLNNKKAQSVIEYTVIITLFLGVIGLIFPYLKRGVSGRWQSVGDFFGHGRQYEANDDTLECEYDRLNDYWYEVDCYEEKKCDKACFGRVAENGNRSSEEECKLCISQCWNGFCNN